MNSLKDENQVSAAARQPRLGLKLNPSEGFEFFSKRVIAVFGSCLDFQLIL